MWIEKNSKTSNSHPWLMSPIAIWFDIIRIGTRIGRRWWTLSHTAGISCQPKPLPPDPVTWWADNTRMPISRIQWNTTGICFCFFWMDKRIQKDTRTSPSSLQCADFFRVQAQFFSLIPCKVICFAVVSYLHNHSSRWVLSVLSYPLVN